MADNTRVPLNRIERLIAFVIGSVFGLSIAAIVALIISGLTHADTNSGLWLSVKVLPAIGLPIGLLLLLVFAAVFSVRRNRLARDAGQ